MTENGNDVDIVDVESGATELDSTAVEAAGQLPRHGFFTRLYTGTGAFDVIGKRKLWFSITALIVAIAAASIALKGFTFGIDFQGGTKVSFPQVGATGQAADIAAVGDTFSKTIGKAPESVVVVGNGASATVQIRSETLTNEQTNELRNALFEKFQPKGTDGKPTKQAISDSAVSETWGGQITKKALIALAVFLVLVTIYITVRYERYMAMAALLSLGLDMITVAGIYSLIGFEVTPATVIGLLTILGFSLYDTVIEHTTRRTVAEQANLAINQTFLRSINTSLISLMPVLALIVVAVWLLGVGTLKDLALVQLVGIIVGTYSSIFFATPLLVTLREHTAFVRTHTQRVLNRRSAAGTADLSTKVGGERVTVPADAAAIAASGDVPESSVRPLRPSRPSGKRER